MSDFLAENISTVSLSLSFHHVCGIWFGAQAKLLEYGAVTKMCNTTHSGTQLKSLVECQQSHIYAAKEQIKPRKQQNFWTACSRAFVLMSRYGTFNPYSHTTIENGHKSVVMLYTVLYKVVCACVLNVYALIFCCSSCFTFQYYVYTVQS